MQKHTQGEWFTHRNPITKQWQVWARNGKSGSKICDVFEGDHHEGDDLPQEDTIFNARLIAISPKLLDKLQKNLSVFKELKTVYSEASLKLHAKGIQIQIDELEALIKETTE